MRITNPSNKKYIVHLFSLIFCFSLLYLNFLYDPKPITHSTTQWKWSKMQNIASFFYDFNILLLLLSDRVLFILILNVITLKSLKQKNPNENWKEGTTFSLNWTSSYAICYILDVLQKDIDIFLWLSYSQIIRVNSVYCLQWIHHNIIINNRSIRTQIFHLKKKSRFLIFLVLVLLFNNTFEMLSQWKPQIWNYPTFSIVYFMILTLMVF